MFSTGGKFILTPGYTIFFNKKLRLFHFFFFFFLSHFVPLFPSPPPTNSKHTAPSLSRTNGGDTTAITTATTSKETNDKGKTTAEIEGRERRRSAGSARTVGSRKGRRTKQETETERVKRKKKS